jgi:hypothetical protein
MTSAGRPGGLKKPFDRPVFQELPGVPHVTEARRAPVRFQRRAAHHKKSRGGRAPSPVGVACVTAVLGQVWSPADYVECLGVAAGFARQAP